MPFLEDKQNGGLVKAGDIMPAVTKELEGIEASSIDADNHLEIEAKEREYDIARLGGLLAYEDFTFKRYDNKGAIASCEGFPDCNLFIHGKTGTGKTHLAVALIRGSKSASMIKPQRIFRIVRGNGRQDAEDEQKAINRLVRQPILAIDDLGANKDSEYSTSLLYEILDGRLMQKKNGLIITSNFSLNELATRFGGDQVTSRIAGLCRIISLNGSDRRLMEAK